MKTGIFFSRCEGVFEGQVDIDALADEYRPTSAVKVYDSFFNMDSFNDLLSHVKEHELDSVILAGESHYFYQQIRNGDFIFKSLHDRGVNVNRVEVVNLKNMVAMPHKGQSADVLMKKSRMLIDAGLQKIKHSNEIRAMEIAPRKSVVIVGVNTSSFIVSQHLLDAGYKVYMINSSPELELPKDEAQYIQPTIPYVMKHKRLQVFNSSEVSDFYGYPGDYTVLVKDDQGKEDELSVGAVVLSLHTDKTIIKAAQTAFHIDISADGRLVARDEVTARSLTLDRGIFVVNPPKDDEADLGQKFQAADATASVVINLLNKREIYHEVKVSEVQPELCSGCGACVKTCMFHAVTIEGRPALSHIDPRRCRGCGNCVTACPAEARNLVSSPNISLYKAIDVYAEALSGSDEPKVLFVGCDGCGYRCLDTAGSTDMQWPPSLIPLRVVCGGQVDTQLLMYAIVKGFDGVLVGICGEGCCHNIIGNVDLERRANLFFEILDSRGVDPSCVKIISTCSRSGKECVENINEFYKRFESVGMETIVLK